MDVWWFPTIFYIKIWFIIQLKHPFINGCLGFQVMISYWTIPRLIADSWPSKPLTDNDPPFKPMVAPTRSSSQGSRWAPTWLLGLGQMFLLTWPFSLCSCCSCFCCCCCCSCSYRCGGSSSSSSSCCCCCCCCWWWSSWWWWWWCLWLWLFL